MSLSLIIPIAADRVEYENNLPFVFNFSNDGTLLCIKSIQGLDLSCFDVIYFTILKKHDIKYCISKLLEIQFEKLNLKKIKVVILDKPTSCQAETIYKTIKLEKIEGAIFIKDSDSFFNCEISRKNSIVIYPLDKLEMVDPMNKSYVSIDEQFYITNIIEKKIISRYFNAGGYLFEDAEQFCLYYQKLATSSGIYLSHIVYCMLLNKISFRPLFCDDYKDWGNIKLYKFFN